MTTAPAANTPCVEARDRSARFSTRVLAIDPGPVQSAWVLLNDNGLPVAFSLGRAAVPNEDVLRVVSNAIDCVLVLERVASFGMPVGESVFETVYWTGRFAQAFRGHVQRVKRHEIKLHLCKSARANDASIRQAIIDRFGGKEVAIGKKAAPGWLHGVHADGWAALALGLTWWDQNVAAVRT